MDNKRIELRRIEESNFIDCFNLELDEGQDKFVSHPIKSLAKAYVYYNQCTPFGIYADDKMVGYVMVIYDYDAEEYDIWHLMIDKKYQGNGFGKKAVKRCMEYISTKPFGSSNKVALTCHENNLKGIKLYKSLGFEATGNRDEDEIEMAMYVK